MLVITAYFEDLDMDTVNEDSNVQVLISGIAYRPDMFSSIGSD